MGMPYSMGVSGRTSTDAPLPFQVGFTTVRPGDVKKKNANLNFQEVTFDGKTIRVHTPSGSSDEGDKAIWASNYVANYPYVVNDKTDFVAGAVVGIRFRPLSDGNQKGNIESQIDWTVDGKKWTTFSGLPEDQKDKINSYERQQTVNNKVRVCFTASPGVVISMNMGNYLFVHAKMKKNDENQDLLSFSEENVGEIKPLLKNACWSNFYMIKAIEANASISFTNAGISFANDLFRMQPKVKETDPGSLCSFDDLIQPP